MTTQTLEAVAKRLRALDPGQLYRVKHQAELKLFRDLSDSELRAFARRNGLNVVRRMEGTQIDFTPLARHNWE